MPWSGQRVTVMGLGRFGGGVAVARWLASRGAVVTVTDTADAASLADSIAALNNARIAAWHLGGHMEADFRDIDLVVVNPAVRPNNRFLQIAQDAETPLTTEMELFLRACPAPVIGVTGANGKSTTAAMTAAILEADGHRVWLGGNLGGSLLDDLDRISSRDWVVLELSSFQLCRLSATTPMPRVAIVTNCTPNHLDWHGGYTEYVAAKQRILSGQTADSVAVLGESLAEDSTWRRQVRGRRLALLPETDIPSLLIPGKHNRCNAVYAATAAHGVGCGDEAIRRGLEGFSGLPGRLQLVATIEGRFFFNDTTATTPESTIAALTSLTLPIWLLAGGSDKGIDLTPMASAVVEKTCGAAFFGATAATLCPRVKAISPGFSCVERVNLSEALDWCWRRSRPGDAIILSPGCASHDQFQNFRQRGEQFGELVHDLPCLAERS